jgi:hypothetical protein
VLELSLGNHERAREHFQEALAKARNAMERRYFEQRLAACEAPGVQPTAGQFWESSLEFSQSGDDEQH